MIYYHESKDELGGYRFILLRLSFREFISLEFRNFNNIDNHYQSREEKVSFLKFENNDILDSIELLTSKRAFP